MWWRSSQKRSAPKRSCANYVPSSSKSSSSATPKTLSTSSFAPLSTRITFRARRRREIVAHRAIEVRGIHADAAGVENAPDATEDAEADHATDDRKSPFHKNGCSRLLSDDRVHPAGGLQWTRTVLNHETGSRNQKTETERNPARTITKKDTVFP